LNLTSTDYTKFYVDISAAGYYYIQNVFLSWSFALLSRKWISLSIALLVTFTLSLFSFQAQALAGKQDQLLYKKVSRSFERLKKDVRKRRYRDQWERVISGFDSFVRRYPSSPYAGYAAFNKAEAVHAMYRVSRTKQDLADAAGAYDEFANKYPDNENVAEALDKAGAIYMELGDKDNAAKRYSDLVNRFSKSIYAEGARKALASLPRVEAAQAQPAGVTSGLSRVSDIRHWSNPDSTRVVIELDGNFKYEGHLIKAPDRLFFDIEGAYITSPFKDGPIDINDGLLKSVRSSQYNSDTVRVVLDLDSVGDYSTLMLPDPPRLVVDVYSANATTGKICPQPSEKYAETKGQGSVNPPVKPGGDDKLSLARQMGLCITKIVIDPGHGGKDSGAVGKHGLKEKDVVLDIGKRLRDIIQSKLDCQVVMTRDSDVFVDLDARPVVARKQNADLFISIHANASRNRRASGVETYLLNLTKDRGIMEVAARENATTMKNMSDINSILFDLVLDNKRDESLELAHKVQHSLVKDLKVIDKGVKQGPFLVLYGASVPSILTEVGFISNPSEEKRLRSPKYRQEIAEAIFDGVKDYIESTKVPTYSASK
jgi:N-acetylmuramoyl-L-alanine amidase